MLVFLIESLRYSGHIYPVACLRIYVGYFFLLAGWTHYEGQFLVQPDLAGMISQWTPLSDAPIWYKEFLENFVVSHWQIFAYCIFYAEFLIGISFILGFLVRPVSIVGLILSINMFYITPVTTGTVYKVLVALFLTLGWLGAGRCLGLDYIFFKRNRGFWW